MHHKFRCGIFATVLVSVLAVDRSGCGGDARCISMAASLRRRKAVLSQEAQASLRAERICKIFDDPYDRGLSLTGVADFVAARQTWRVTQFPEREDGIGARLWAK